MSRSRLDCLCLVLGVLVLAPASNAETSAQLVAAAATAAPAVDGPALPSLEAASALYGRDFGAQVHALGIAPQISPDALMDGLEAGLAGKEATTMQSLQVAQAFVGATRNKTGSVPSDAVSGTPSALAASRVYGVNFGEHLQKLGLSHAISLEEIRSGLRFGLAGDGAISQQDRQSLQRYVDSVVASVAAKNRQLAAEFLAKNRHDRGVKATPSGLEYKILAPGDPKAASPLPTDQVEVEYRGTLLDGTEFDSTVKGGSAVKLPLASVIKGWQEALPRMKEGAKWQLFVPPDLGYGNANRPTIPAGSLLIFEVKLVRVVDSKKPDSSPETHAEPSTASSL